MFSFRGCRKLMLFGVLFLSAVLAFGQNRITVSGRITDSTGEMLPGASVAIEGTTTGTVSNAEGVFRLEAPVNSTLVISFIGYISQKVRVTGQTEINVVLEAEDKFLSEVVVVGYAEQSRARTTSASSRRTPSPRRWWSRRAFCRWAAGP